MAPFSLFLLPNGTNVCFHGFLWSSPSTCLPICLRPSGRFPFVWLRGIQVQLVVFVGGPLLKTFVPLEMFLPFLVSAFISLFQFPFRLACRVASACRVFFCFVWLVASFQLIFRFVAPRLHIHPNFELVSRSRSSLSILPPMGRPRPFP